MSVAVELAGDPLLTTAATMAVSCEMLDGSDSQRLIERTRAISMVANGAPSSGYLASLFLNVVESSPRAALLPFVVQAATAWSSANGIDTNFWSENDIGGKVCAWLDGALTADSASATVLPRVADDLLKCLDILIRGPTTHIWRVPDRVEIARRCIKPAGTSLIFFPIRSGSVGENCGSRCPPLGATGTLERSFRPDLKRRCSRRYSGRSPDQR